jgi:hypothetical protein
LRAHDWSWGNVGYCYLESDEPRTAIDWLSDWRERKELEPWMLWNLVLALRERDQDAEAYQVSEHSLTLPPDSMSDAHTLLLAIEDLLNQRSDLGDKRLEHINVGALREWDKFVYELATALQDADHARSPHGISYHIILERLDAARREFSTSQTSDLLVVLHRRVAWRVAQRSGNLLLILRTAVQLSGQAIWRTFFGQPR